MEPSAVLGPNSKAEIDSVVAAYLSETKHWKKDEFRIEYKGIRDHWAIVWAIFTDDELHPKPGGGKSVELHVNLNTHRVDKELGFQ